MAQSTSEQADPVIGHPGESPAAHTPGPWRVVCHSQAKDVGLPAYLVGGDSLIVAEIKFNRSLDDARLIAAAPELLVALTDMITGAIQMGHGDHPFVARARAAIAKATGA